MNLKYPLMPALAAFASSYYFVTKLLNAMQLAEVDYP